MPTLNWIGKDAVIDHHRQVPYHLLRCDEKLSVGDPGEPIIPKRPNGKNPSPLIGVCNGTAYYLLFNGVLGDKRPDGGNVLTRHILAELPGFAGKPLRPGEPAHDGPKVIYGEGSRLGAARLKREGVMFKQVPYEIRVS